MKKLNILLIAIVAIVLGGCVKDDSYEDNRVTTPHYSYCVDKVHFEGHTYLIINTVHRGGICHDENCKCKTDSIK